MTGQKILDEIIKQGMVRTDDVEPSLLIWNANTADQLDALIQECESNETKRYRAALEMIAGRRQCPDNLMGNVDIANAALSV